SALVLASVVILLTLPLSGLNTHSSAPPGELRTKTIVLPSREIAACRPAPRYLSLEPSGATVNPAGGPPRLPWKTIVPLSAAIAAGTSASSAAQRARAGRTRRERRVTAGILLDRADAVNAPSTRIWRRF